MRRQMKADRFKCYPADRVFDGDEGQRLFFEALGIVISELVEDPADYTDVIDQCERQHADE